MIIITGPGRSGTSVLARLYQELGFDPGGRWHPDVNAGLEAPEIIAANTDIAVDLGMAFLRPRLSVPAAAVPASRLLPRAFRRAVYTRLARRRPPELMQWDRLPQTVEKHRAALLALSAGRTVVKDPRFCWTLPVWVAAGVQIDQVVVSLRDLEAMSASRAAAQHTSFSAVALRNMLVYAVGMVTTTIHEHDLPHALLRFPDFLDKPAELHRKLLFPKPVSQHDVVVAMARLHRPHLVHHRP